MTKKLFAAFAIACCIGLLSVTPAGALVVVHETESYEGTIDWICPGRNPVESYVQTWHSAVFKRDGKAVRRIVHITWRGAIRHRETGAVIRDNANWTDVYILDGHRVLRSYTSGVIWRLAIPGHGIVVHQSGHLVYNNETDTEWSSPQAMSPDISAMCPYV